MSRAFKYIMLTAIVGTVAYILFTSNDRNTMAIFEMIGRLLLLIGVIFGAIKAYRKRKQSNLSSEQHLLAEAGGAEKLLARTNSNLWFIRIILLSPAIFFAFASWHGSMEIAIQGAAAVALPALPIGLLAYWYQSKIKSHALHELGKSKSKGVRIYPFAK